MASIKSSGNYESVVMRPHFGTQEVKLRSGSQQSVNEREYTLPAFMCTVKRGDEGGHGGIP